MAYQKVNAIFSSPERKAPGTGGIFSIFVSDLCKGCAACVTACGDHMALKMVQETTEVNAEHETGTDVAGQPVDDTYEATITFHGLAKLAAPVMQLEFQKLPFSDVAISGFVRDPDRKKLSKSAGNSPDDPFAGNVPYRIGGKCSADLLSFYFASSYRLEGGVLRSSNMRARGCP